MADQSLCGVDGCDKPARAGKLGLCGKHESRLKRHGTTSASLNRKYSFHNITVGDQFGSLVVVGSAEKTSRERRWHVRCSCGELTFRDTGPLVSGSAKDCGCSRRETHDTLGRMKSTHVNLPIGMQFGRLTVLGNETTNGKNYSVSCRCDCGVEVRCRVDGLTAGKKLQCGAHPRVLTDEQKAVISRRSKSHGMSRTPEYNSWCGMKARCGNVKDSRYSDYGGRGITIYPGWVSDFRAFLAYVGPRPSDEYSLDRIDVNGNYVPGNVRWADKSTQTRNRRPFFVKTKESHSPIPEPAFIPPQILDKHHHKQSHGMSLTPEYHAWSAMKKRCLDAKHPAYRNYGGRGVRIYTPWVTSFEQFLAEVGMRPEGKYSLDRRDNSKGYEPGNVRWSDSFTQNRNRRGFLVTPKQT